MKMPIVFICVAAGLAAAAAVPCMAIDPEFSGTWKLEIKLTAETFTITSAGGRMHYSNGATISYEFTCDEKEYTDIADRTGTCKKNSDTSHDFTNNVKGNMASMTTRTISADGNTLTAVTSDMNPDESLVSTINTFTRLSGGPDGEDRCLLSSRYDTRHRGLALGSIVEFFPTTTLSSWSQD